VFLHPQFLVDEHQVLFVGTQHGIAGRLDNVCCVVTVFANFHFVFQFLVVILLRNGLNFVVEIQFQY